MIIIKPKIQLPERDLQKLQSSLVEMKKDGIIVLPLYCDVVYISEENEEIVEEIVYDKN